MKLKTLKIEKIDYSNKEHYEFLQQMTNEENMNYLWDISNKDYSINQNERNYLVYNEHEEKIGYVNISEPTEAKYGNTSSIYYAITEKSRCKGYGSKIVKEISEFLFEIKEIDCIIAEVDKENTGSYIALTKAGFEIVYKSDEDYIFMLKTIGTIK